MKDGFMSVTLKEIAKVAGVSPTTVSYALRGKNPGKFKLSPDTVSHVNKIAKKLGYQPNFLAAGLRNSKSFNLGVLIRFFRGDIFSDVLTEFRNTIHPDYETLIAVHDNDGDEERRSLEIFASKRVDGVLAQFSGDDKSVEQYRILTEQFGIPVVLCDCGVPGLELPVVRCDHYGGTYKATTTLEDLGHKKIKYVCSANKKEIADLRREGYINAMQERGLENRAEIVTKPHIDVESWKDGSFRRFAREVINQWEKQGRDATAIVVADDFLAYEMLAVCEEEKQIRIPEELSVISIGDRFPSGLSRVGLSTVTADYELLGSSAAELLLKLINGGQWDGKPIIIPVSVRLRKTAGPPVRSRSR